MARFPKRFAFFSLPFPRLRANLACILLGFCKVCVWGGGSLPLRVYRRQIQKKTFGVCATAHSRTRAAYAPLHIAARRIAYDAVTPRHSVRQYDATPSNGGSNAAPVTPRFLSSLPPNFAMLETLLPILIGVVNTLRTKKKDFHETAKAIPCIGNALHKSSTTDDNNLQYSKSSALNSISCDENYNDDFVLPIADPWCAPNHPVTVHHLEITGGFFSCGELLPTKNGDAQDPALIRPSLPVQITNDENHVAQTAPSNAPITTTAQDRQVRYESLLPHQRYDYLKWLASDRTDPNTPLDFRLLYFFGLERRLLIDGPKRHAPTKESQQILDEIRRLTAIFKDDKTLDNAAQKLRAFYWTTTHHLQFDVAVPSDIDFCAPVNAPFLPWILAKYALQFRPVPPRLLLAWYHAHPDFGRALETRALPNPDDLSAAFSSNFAQYYPHGMTLQPNHVPLIIHYDAVNPGIGKLDYHVREGCNVFDETHLLQKLDPIVKETIDQLGLFS